MRNKLSTRPKRKPIRCGLLFSPALIQPKHLQPEMSAELRGALGSDIHDSISFQELTAGLHLQFKTYWQPDREGFTIGKGVGNMDENMICMLQTENELRGLKHRDNIPFFQGKRVLEWERVKKRVRLGIRIALRHAAYMEGNDVRFWIVGDADWLPKAFRRNPAQETPVDNAMIFSISESET